MCWTLLGPWEAELGYPHSQLKEQAVCVCVGVCVCV